MNLYFRLILTLIASLWKPKIKPTTTVRTAFRVWPWDLDALGHMNNGRYLQIMDVARIDWMRQARIIDAIARNRWGALLGGSIIRYNSALNLFQKFYVETRVVSWDHRWFFLEHKFVNTQGKTIAIANTRAALRKKTGWVHTEEIIEDVIPGLRSPRHSSQVKAWLMAEDMLSGQGAFQHLNGQRKPVLLQDGLNSNETFI